MTCVIKISKYVYSPMFCETFTTHNSITEALFTSFTRASEAPPTPPHARVYDLIFRRRQGVSREISVCHKNELKSSENVSGKKARASVSLFYVQAFKEIETFCIITINHKMLIKR